MYRLLLFLYLLIPLIIFNNREIESSVRKIYSEPEGWTTSNPDAIRQTGIFMNKKVEGVTGFALRLETIIRQNEIIEGAAVNTCIDLPEDKQGQTCFEIPTALTGAYRYYLPDNDTAFIMVIFMCEDEILSRDIFKIKGNGILNDFTNFRLPFTLNEEPDRVLIAISASDIVNRKNIRNGSYIEIDDLAFENCSVPVFNGNFENWTDHEYSDNTPEFTMNFYERIKNR